MFSTQILKISLRPFAYNLVMNPSPEQKSFEGIPYTQLIQRRFSCRKYDRAPIAEEKQDKLTAFLDNLPSAPFDKLRAVPFGTRPRFNLVAAQKNDSQVLRGLGTYGFIRNAAGFIVGTITPAKYDLEDYGYLLEMTQLYATALDLGTCWLGGTFTKSRFAKKVALGSDESIPAISAIGEYAAKEQKRAGWVSQVAGSFKRLQWEQLFSNVILSQPLYRSEAGAYARPLEMVQIAPSASNKQPWRIVRNGGFWRFYLRRTAGYEQDPLKRFLDLCDMQRIDMGIAMCHFELAARELGLNGQWVIEDDLDRTPNKKTEYIVSWQSLDNNQ